MYSQTIQVNLKRGLLIKIRRVWLNQFVINFFEINVTAMSYEDLMNTLDNQFIPSGNKSVSLHSEIPVGTGSERESPAFPAEF